jgi:hypothetical protein
MLNLSEDRPWIPVDGENAEILGRLHDGKKRFRIREVECRGVAQPGSAPALGAGGRVFKSRRPDQPRSGYAAGSVNKKVDDRPGSDSTQIFPP